MLAIADAPWLLLFYGPVNRWTADMVRKIVDKPVAKISTIRFGTFTSVVFHFIMWLGARREKIVLELQERFFAAVHDLIGHDADNKAPLIIVWQSESFLDMRRLGVDTLNLPTLDRLQKRASQWGVLATVFEGGYTLRTEFAVLSGLLPRRSSCRCELSLSARQPLYRRRLADEAEECGLEHAFHPSL